MNYTSHFFIFAVPPTANLMALVAQQNAAAIGGGMVVDAAWQYPGGPLQLGKDIYEGVVSARGRRASANPPPAKRARTSSRPLTRLSRAKITSRRAPPGRPSVSGRVRRGRRHPFRRRRLRGRGYISLRRRRRRRRVYI